MSTTFTMKVDNKTDFNGKLLVDAWTKPGKGMPDEFDYKGQRIKAVLKGSKVTFSVIPKKRA